MRNLLLIPFLVALLVLPSCDVENQQAKALAPIVASTLALTTTPTPAPAARRCGISIDATPSVSDAARQAALHRIGESISKLVDDEQCRSVSLAVFTNKGWFTPVMHYTFAPEHHEACAAAAPTPAHKVLAPFEGYRRSTNQQCMEQFEQEKRQAIEARKPIIAAITAALSKVATIDVPCTDIYTHIALINHIRGEHDLDWVITDSAQSCQDDLTIPVANVTFIVIPSNGDPREVAARGMTNVESLTKRFPGSSYLLPAQLAADGWWKGRTQ